MLLNRSPEYWAREASLQELQTEVRKLVTWTEQAAEVLDFVYMERGMRVLARTQAGSREDALALADHLERVAHDSVRDALDRLERPYFARWRFLSEIMHRCALRLDVPHKVLDRKHVRELLLRIHAAGGRIAQGDLTLIPNEGQRSATLKLMEQWDLIERRAEGTARLVSITDLGRLAIAEELAARGTSEARTRTAGTLERGCTYMYAVS
ncbi:MAG TPA: hypothetical protein VN253_25190 [Kofleriaceae bacterium]|nr:hypothetical protein [Kofleriaceae bacterium]